MHTYIGKLCLMYRAKQQQNLMQIPPIWPLINLAPPACLWAVILSTFTLVLVINILGPHPINFTKQYQWSEYCLIPRVCTTIISLQHSYGFYTTSVQTISSEYDPFQVQVYTASTAFTHSQLIILPIWSA